MNVVKDGKNKVKKYLTILTLLLLFLAVFTFAPGVSAKCTTGKVAVRGRIENLPSTGTGVEATVVVESKNGTVSRTVPVSRGEFAAEVPFSRFSSSFLGSDRCNTVPTFVEVKIGSAGKVFIQKKLDFKDNFFEETGTYHYRLKQELSLDVPKERADTQSNPRLLWSLLRGR
jgi:hypothetical protein